MNQGNEPLFDIVTLIGPNENDQISTQIGYTKKNIIGYRNIYLICYDPTIKVDGCITINENIFPFDKETVEKYHKKPNRQKLYNRNGWYLQQLLKLYAGRIIPNILDKYLVIDSDTFFLKKTTFIKDNKCLYNYANPECGWNKSYFDHMSKLDKNFIKSSDHSGICHHMIFEKKYIDEIFSIVETNHNDYFYNIFLKEVDVSILSGASEYEIYFNYMLKNNYDKIQIRKLKYIEPMWSDYRMLKNDTSYDYICYHIYKNNKKKDLNKLVYNSSGGSTKEGKAKKNK
tara:strand:+ start:1308 stop:2165 length:858 start_codon:yes stop_codon:yes gene_type:complete